MAEATAATAARMATLEMYMMGSLSAFHVEQCCFQGRRKGLEAPVLFYCFYIRAQATHLPAASDYVQK
jgi:hypothetical protein